MGVPLHSIERATMVGKRAVVGIWIGVLAPGRAQAGPPSAGVTYWQEPACTSDHEWCAEWVRFLEDRRMEVGCQWGAERASQGFDVAGRKLYLVDPSGRRYYPTATSGAAEQGWRG